MRWTFAWVARFLTSHPVSKTTCTSRNLPNSNRSPWRSQCRSGCPINVSLSICSCWDSHGEAMCSTEWVGALLSLWTANWNTVTVTVVSARACWCVQNKMPQYRDLDWYLLGQKCGRLQASHMRPCSDCRASLELWPESLCGACARNGRWVKEGWDWFFIFL